MTKVKKADLVNWKSEIEMVDNHIILEHGKEKATPELKKFEESKKEFDPSYEKERKTKFREIHNPPAPIKKKKNEKLKPSKGRHS